MWFKGNPEYERSNPSMKGLSPEFSQYTYPSTTSNSGSSSFLSIDNIGNQSDTMSFNIYNSVLADGFPDSSLHIRLVFDIDDDGIMDVIGGNDSLWIGQESDLSNRRYFYSSSNEIYNISIASNNNINRVIIFERDNIISYVNFFAKTPDEHYLEYVLEC